MVSLRTGTQAKGLSSWTAFDASIVQKGTLHAAAGVTSWTAIRTRGGLIALTLTVYHDRYPTWLPGLIYDPQRYDANHRIKPDSPIWPPPRPVSWH
jgi:hypothetical protein